VPGRSRAARASQRGFAQHLLASERLARELVEAARVDGEDTVVEIGGGTGELTAALAERAAHVLTIELDPGFAARLAGRFEPVSNVTVIRADALEAPLPATSYRVVANIPFNRTSAILRRLLDDPTGGLARADLVVQWQVARSRATARDLLAATWGPWWCFARGRRLPAALFRPPPSDDAAILTITRRTPALLPADELHGYASFVRRAFEHSSRSPNVDVKEWVRRFRNDHRTVFTKRPTRRSSS
jgi:23S rRNA (adenine-N6)-dimethyltransferase